MSYMRRFLESNGHSRWLKNGNDSNSIHNDLDGATALSLHWQRAFGDNTGIDVPYELVRVKRIRARGDGEYQKEAQNLTRFLKTIRHPHCVAYLGSYTQSDYLYIMTFPKAQCSLEELMDSVSFASDKEKQSKPTSDFLKSDGSRVKSTPSDSELRGSPALFFSYEDRIRILRRCFVCLPQALSYLHEHFLMHKDISPRNILVDGSGSVLLAGAAEFGSKKRPNHTPGQVSSPYASVYYVSKGIEEALGRASDIFSLGCVLLQVVALVLQQTWRLRGLNLSQPRISAQVHYDFDAIYSLIDILGESGPTFKEQSDSEAVHGVRMIGALPTIREMLNLEPEQRPTAHGLWEKFKWVSLEICADCDPRHPEVWRSQALATSATANADSSVQLAKYSSQELPEASLFRQPSLSPTSSPEQLNSGLLSNLAEKDIRNPEPIVPGNMSVVNIAATSINEENATEKDLRPRRRDYLSYSKHGQKNLWYCGHCHHGPMSRQHDVACLHCYYPENLATEDDDNNATSDAPMRKDERKGFSDVVSIESLSSTPGLMSGSTLSTVSSQEILEAAEELVVLLLQDEHLKPLYDKALERMKTNKFKRKLRKLLGTFAIDLLKEAGNGMQRSAAQLVKESAKYVTSCIGKYYSLGKDEASEHMSALKMQASRRIIKDVGQFEKEPESDESQPDLGDRSQLPKLDGVRSFILDSSAISNLRKNLRRVVFGEPDRFQVEEVCADPPLEAGIIDNSDEIASFEEPDLDESMESYEVTVTQLEPLQKQASLATDSLFRSVLLIIESFSEFLELREKPLRPGCRRIRWTCVRLLFSLK